MPDLFTLDDQVHHAGALDCPGCVEGYPERCSCGGLMHGSDAMIDADSNIALTTQCDHCRRSEGEAEEHVA